MNLSSWKSVIVFGSAVSAFLFVATFVLLTTRSDIAEDAKKIAELEYRILKAQDALQTLVVKVDDSVQPHVLRGRIEGFLQTPVEGQVLRVNREKIDSFDLEKWAANNTVVMLNREGVS